MPSPSRPIWTPGPPRLGPVIAALFFALVLMLSYLLLSRRPISFPTSTSPLSQETDASGSTSSVGPLPTPESPYSFDVAGANNPAWMSTLPDELSLAALSIPGTHDTLTATLGQSYPRLQCQNASLATQLHAGIRYLDVRARLNTTRKREGDGDGDGNGNGQREDERPGNLLIYHSLAWTGSTFTDVMTTVFSFLDTNPGEAIIMRLQREGDPVHVGPDGKPLPIAPGELEDEFDEELAKSMPDMSREEIARAIAKFGSVEAIKAALNVRGNSIGADPEFEKAFNYYRLHDPETAPGFDKHFYDFKSLSPSPSALIRRAAQTSQTTSTVDGASDNKIVPTLGEARGKVVLLQDFDGAEGTRNVYGLPWNETDPRLRIEDMWIMQGPSDLDLKWAAVLSALEYAASDKRQYAGPLFLSHLSASVGVWPVEAAAGVRDENGTWYEGINDRVGRWLETQEGVKGKTGVLISDFPGKKLVDGIIEKNRMYLLRGRN